MENKYGITQSNVPGISRTPFQEKLYLKAKPNVPFCLPWADGITRGAWSCPGCGTARVVDARRQASTMGAANCTATWTLVSYRAIYLAVLIFHRFSQVLDSSINQQCSNPPKLWNLHLTVFPSTGETTAEPYAFNSRPAHTIRISVTQQEPLRPNHAAQTTAGILFNHKKYFILENKEILWMHSNSLNCCPKAQWVVRFTKAHPDLNILTAGLHRS